MQSKISDSFFIPTNLLSFISGGDNNGTPEIQSPSPSSPVIVLGNGTPNVAGGTVFGSIPINSNTTAMPYVNANTVTGITGGGAAIVYRW